MESSSSDLSWVAKLIFTHVNMPMVLEGTFGMDVKWHGDDSAMSLCPFHGDTSPSLSMDLKDGGWVWCCHGCGKGGGIIEFYKYSFNFGFIEAIKRIQLDLDLKFEAGDYINAIVSSNVVVNEKKKVSRIHLILCEECRILLKSREGDKKFFKMISEIYRRMNRALDDFDVEEMEKIGEEIHYISDEEAIFS